MLLYIEAIEDIKYQNFQETAADFDLNTHMSIIVNVTRHHGFLSVLDIHLTI